VIQARDYQEQCRDAVLAALGEKPWYTDGEIFRSALINLPTSAGKTVVAGLIISAVEGRGRCLFLADTNELCDQPLRKFRDQFGINAALEKAEDRASKLADVVIGSAQTLISADRRTRFGPDHFDYIFVDEAHRGSDRNKVITDYFAKAKVVGQTATAFRSKLADLSKYYDTVAFEMGMFDLIDEGYIAPIKVLTLPVEIDIRGVKQTRTVDGMDYDKDELDTKIQPYYEEICRLIMEHAANRRIVAFLPLIKSSQEFTAIARRLGIDARHVDGKSWDRKRIQEQFERGDFQMLCNSSLLTTGWDCPPCDCLLNLAPTRSAGMFRQKVGRIGRLLAGTIDGITDKSERKARIAASAKPDALILDFLWQVERFGLMGPADLIAANGDEKLAIQIRLQGLEGLQDLQGVASAVQEEREAALKQALIDAAKRQSRFNDAINYVAAVLHGRSVTNYEPVSRWHAKPVSKQQREWMVKNGIDPDSAKDRGHVSAFMNLVFGRQRAGLAPWPAVEALEKIGMKGAVSFRDWDAYQVLGGNYPFPFGNYAKRKCVLRQIPYSYLRWCAEQAWMPKKFPIVWDWIKGVCPDAIKVEPGEEGEMPAVCTCIGSYVPPNCPVHPRLDAKKTEEPTEPEPVHSQASFFDCFDGE
jgi:superfamily II DNA or RNA helicase